MSSIIVFCVHLYRQFLFVANLCTYGLFKVWCVVCFLLVLFHQILHIKCTTLKYCVFII